MMAWWDHYDLIGDPKVKAQMLEDRRRWSEGFKEGKKMNTLTKKLLKNTTVDVAAELENSILFHERDVIPTPVPMVNVALSGKLNGGLTSGVTVLAGPSKNFKTGFALLLASAYLRKYPEAALLFYDSEFGAPQNYFNLFSIPMDRVVHTPVADIEDLKHDIVTQLHNLTRDDKVIIIIDSIGVVASRKELDDALEGKSVADMTRAKAIKSLFRMITPHAAIKDVPIIVVNHTYKEIGLYPKDIVSGGTGSYYAADTIWILGRQQDKNGGELQGYNFIINVEKSRFVKEKSRIPISVTFDKGIQKWAGLFDTAVDLGFITSPSKGWYNAGGDQNFRRADVEYDDDFWTKIIADTDFSQAVQDKYMLNETDIIHKEE